MKATLYFLEQVLRKRPEIDINVCAKVISSPLKRQAQADGQIRFWGEAFLGGDPNPRILRVVTLDDGETIHNAFFDRRYRRDPP